jgi:plasmid maintenance system antidote protein VapI
MFEKVYKSIQWKRSLADMEIHLKFLPNHQKIFIEKIIQKSGLSINELATLVNISPKSFRDWKNEKVSISKKAALSLNSTFSVIPAEKVETLEDRWKLNRSQIGRKGGIAYKEKYGNPGTRKGRQKGGFKTLAILRKEGSIPPIVMFRRPAFSSNLAEFIGIMLGDGSLGRLQMSITLNSIKDLDYSYYVVRLCNSLFGHEPKVRKRNNANALEIYYNGANLTRILTKLGLVQGNKVKNQVDVPNWIKLNDRYKIRCLRGLMDTDGGIFIHKYTVNGKTYSYPKAAFSNHSIPLLMFVYTTLKGLEFHPKIHKNMVNKNVWLYNSHEINKYLTVVGSSNLRLNNYKHGGVA